MKRILEGLLFAADEPLSITQIRRFWKDLQPKEASHAIRELAEEYEREDRSFHLVEIENGYQLLTKREYYPWVGRMRNDIKTFRLSRAALETLAIISYKQPVTRAEIEEIRGVDVGGVLKKLMDRNLITLKGRAEGVGRPLLYGTTEFFLNHFGLRSLDDMPKPEELSELMKSKELQEIHEEVEDKLGPAPQNEDAEDESFAAEDDDARENDSAEAEPERSESPDEGGEQDGEVVGEAADGRAGLQAGDDAREQPGDATFEDEPDDSRSPDEALAAGES